MATPRHITAALLLMGLLTGSLLVGCGPRRIIELDGVYYAWDQRRVLCGVSIDDDQSGDFYPDLGNIREGMERARDRDEVLIFYAHKPGVDVSEKRLEGVLALAQELGLPFLTFDELHGEPLGAGVAITFDDSTIDAWHGQRDLFAAYSARVTFFVTRFHQLSDGRIEKLHELYADGHAIESHGLNHLNAPDYVEEYGLRAYIDDEIVPSLEAMRAEGFTPTTFAYPFGARTSELDHAILEHVELVRSIAWLRPTRIITDPCPR